MNVIEMYSKEDCKLCDDAKAIMERLKSEFSFELKEIKLTTDHPQYSSYKNSVPVILAPNGKKAAGKISEDQARALLLSLAPPPGIYYTAKFLQALAIVVVFFGFAYGLLGDMWTDLYFFLSGIIVFVIGWGLESWEARQRKKRIAA